jgi:hypothetical protein
MELRYPQLLRFLNVFLQNLRSSARARLATTPHQDNDHRRRSLVRVNDAATRGRILSRSEAAGKRSSSIQNHGKLALPRSESPLSDAAALCFEQGRGHGWTVR